jgi:hypothetical protein
MKHQPQSFIDMSAAVSNQRSKKHGFRNTDEVGKVPHAIKEAARLIVAILTETDAEGYFEYQVYPDKQDTRPGEITYNIQVPYGRSVFVNKIWVPDPFDEKGVAMVVERMAKLASQRTYPPGSFFTAPWGTYLIHGGTIGKI